MNKSLDSKIIYHNENRIKGLELLDKLDCTGQPPAYDSYSDD